MRAALEERVGRLEKKVEQLANEEVMPLKAKVHELDTWAGPGQNMTFSDSLADFRKQLAAFGKVQAAHTEKLNILTKDVAVLKADMAGLKADMVEVKGALGEILDRLPPRQGTRGS